MAVKSYTWVAWSDARRCMPEVWPDWHWLPRRVADKAMANVLRRGNVPYRRAPLAPPVSRLDPPLAVIVAGLVSTDGHSAEYETEAGAWSGTRPVNVFYAELAWEPFRDDLILYELPAGADPNPDTVASPSRPIETVHSDGEEQYPDVEHWARQQWGEDLSSLPDRKSLVAFGKAVFAGFGFKHANWLRRKLATADSKKGGARMHRTTRRSREQNDR